jgi:hypothetical protein
MGSARPEPWKSPDPNKKKHHHMSSKQKSSAKQWAAKHHVPYPSWVANAHAMKKKSGK